MSHDPTLVQVEATPAAKEWLETRRRLQSRRELADELKQWLNRYDDGGRLDVGGARMAFVNARWGTADGEGLTPRARHDAPLLCLHGNPTWSWLFRPVCDAFGLTNQVVIPDHIGCGFSDKPQDYPYTLERHIENVERLVDHLGLKKVTLCVHDWGGAIGFGLAARRPELIDRMVVFNTAAFAMPTMPLSIALCRAPAFGAIAVRGFNAFLRGALARCTVSPLSAESRQGFLLPYGNWRDRVAIHRFVQDIPMGESHRSWRTLKEIEAALPKLAAKSMLICWGARDFVFNDSFLAEWRRRFPAAEVHRFEQAGHWLLEDVGPEVCVAMKNFLGVTP